MVMIAIHQETRRHSLIWNQRPPQHVNGRSLTVDLCEIYRVLAGVSDHKMCRTARAQHMKL